MADLKKLSELMKKDWDRRVSHDYRFWMSDGVRDDATMWESGQRDFAILTEGLEGLEDCTLLELGCGVGRLLRPALAHAKTVIGVDVSEKAIAKARELLGTQPGLDLRVGNGVDLDGVASSSVDFLFSFAAITSIPTKVIGSYLAEFHRVLKSDGFIRLQVYIGEVLSVAEQDTLQLRCYRKENLLEAFQLAGLNVISIEELRLPFKVSFAEIGIEAFIVTLTKNSDIAPQSPEAIAAALLPEGEPAEGAELAPEDVEAWMTKNYAEKLAEEGDLEKAQRALEYVSAHLTTTSIDTRDVLDKIVAATEKSRPTQFSGEIFEKNLRCLSERFPAIAAMVREKFSPSRAGAVALRPSAQGPVVYVGSQCLDHADKPASAASAWVERSLADKRFGDAAHVIVYGFAGGYHVESLVEKIAPVRRVSCIEPSIEVFGTALGARDMTGALGKLEGLSIGEQRDLPFISRDAELLTRPQTLATSGDYGRQVKGMFYGKRGMVSLHPKIGIVGPLEGGTLPMTQYVYNSMVRLGQRARGLDLSGFGKGLHLLDEFVKFPPRQKALHGTYVEMMSCVLLESFTEKPIDILICMAQAPVSPRFLMEMRKRGVITVLWFVEDYLRFTYWQQMAQFFDFVFTIQKGECLDAIKKAGAGETHYLPTACDPDLHKPVAISEEERKRWGSPVSFVGAGYYNRQQTFAALAGLPLKIWGTEWPQCKPFDRLVQEEGRRLTPDEYIKIFNATDININLHSSSERDGVDPFGDFLNPRLFELAATGAFQLVDQRAYLNDCFDIGKEMITFSSVPQLKEMIAYYMSRPEERLEVAHKSRERVLRDHTYDRRIEEMLSVIYASKYETLRLREENSPWMKMLKRSENYEELHDRCERAFARGEEPTLDALISDIVTGNGDLTDTEQKLLFLFHVRKQIIRMTREEAGENK